MLLIFFSAVLALCFVIGKGEETKFILSTGGVLKYPQSGAEFEIHKFQGLKKKIQPLFGRLSGSDISRTKPPMILVEPTRAWLGGEMNGGVVLGI